MYRVFIIVIICKVKCYNNLISIKLVENFFLILGIDGIFCYYGNFNLFKGFIVC